MIVSLHLLEWRSVTRIIARGRFKLDSSVLAEEVQGKEDAVSTPRTEGIQIQY